MASLSLTNGFQDISAENSEVNEVESLCMACERNGTTRLLMVKIPFYKEIFVSSFSCPHCGYSNSSSMAGQEIQEEASEITLSVSTTQDMSRTVVMSDYAALRIPELDFEAPYRRQSFGITTVEGVITKVKEMIVKFMEARGSSEEGILELSHFVPKLNACLQMEIPFHLVIDDPSGNSFIENPHAPNPDPELVIRTYRRNQELDELCGIQPESSQASQDNVDPADEVMIFPTTCYNCREECVTNMKTIDVPHFKELLIMSSVCEKCGWRNNEAKPAGGIEQEGCTLDLYVTGSEDLDRHVIKSATCALRIPELDFEMLASDHSSRYTNVEGLLSNIKDELVDKNPFIHGDSANLTTTDKLAEFGNVLQEVIDGKRTIHFILDDPAGNSFIETLNAGNNDERLCVSRYKRSAEQDEDLGITAMNTENYDEA